MKNKMPTIFAILSLVFLLLFGITSFVEQRKRDKEREQVEKQIEENYRIIDSLKKETEETYKKIKALKEGS